MFLQTLLSSILILWSPVGSARFDGLRISGASSYEFDFNPSSIMDTSEYEALIGASFMKNYSMRIALKDSVTSQVGGAIGFVCVSEKIMCTGKREGGYLNIASAYPFLISEKILMAAGGSVIYSWGDNMTPAFLHFGSGVKLTYKNLFSNFSPILGLSGYGRAALSESDKIFLPPNFFSVSVGLKSEEIFFGMQENLDFYKIMKTTESLGAEIKIFQWFNLRGGYSSDGTIGFGLGFVSPRFFLHISGMEKDGFGISVATGVIVAP